MNDIRLVYLDWDSLGDLEVSKQILEDCHIHNYRLGDFVVLENALDLELWASDELAPEAKTIYLNKTLRKYVQNGE